MLVGYPSELRTSNIWEVIVLTGMRKKHFHNQSGRGKLKNIIVTILTCLLKTVELTVNFKFLGIARVPVLVPILC